MKYSTQVKPISYLKSHPAEIVTQNGEAKLEIEDRHITPAADVFARIEAMDRDDEE